MSASLCIDTSDIQSGALTIGNVGGGVLAEDIPTGFTDESYLENDISLPGDAGKEIRGLLLTVPSAGTFVAYEDGSFDFTGAPDGAYTFSYQLIVDYVNVGSPVTSNINVGAGSYSVSRAESAAAAEAASAIRAAMDAAAETFAASDAATALRAAAASTAETVGASEAAAAVRAALASASEGAAVSEVSSATLSAPGDYLRDVIEAASIADSITSSAAQTAAQIESAAIGGEATIVAALAAGSIETAAMADNCSAVLGTAPTTHSAFWTFAVPADRDYRFAVLARDNRFEVH